MKPCNAWRGCYRACSTGILPLSSFTRTRARRPCYSETHRLLAHLVYIVFFFALGACIGSFLNVVVWRLPRGESLVSPPSRCPHCGHKLAWRDNLPVIGWIMLRGKCRYCGSPISPRYPIIEAITALLFVAYYVSFFIFQQGPCAARPMMTADEFGYLHSRALNINLDWPIFALYLFLLSSLLAASLIDAESFTI